jgi:hypothetical protein
LRTFHIILYRGTIPLAEPNVNFVCAYEVLDSILTQL